MYRFACNQPKMGVYRKKTRRKVMKAIEQLEYTPKTLARKCRTTDRKSLLAFRGVGAESEAESVRPMRAWMTKVGPEVKSYHGLGERICFLLEFTILHYQ
jgi:hypothetical protein